MTASPDHPTPVPAWRAADLLALAPHVLGAPGAGLLVVVSLGAFTGLSAPLLVAVGLGLVVAGYGLGQVGGGHWTGWRGWAGLAQGAALAAARLGGLALAQPEATKLVWAPAALLLYAQGRAVEAAGGPAAWRLPLVMPLLFVCGLAEGSGLFTLLAPLAMSEPMPDWAGGLLVGTVAARLLVWMTYRRRVAATTDSPALATRLMTFSTPFTVGGTVMPLGLAVAAGMMPSLTLAALAAAGLAVAAAGGALKLALLARPHDFGATDI